MNTIDNYKEKNKYSIITEYDPSFCDLYIEYAKTYANPDGFWGKYNIDESMKDVWIKSYPEFKQTVALIPNITINVLNESIQKVFELAVKTSDTRTVTQMVLKMLEFNFKVSKEGGEIKDKARTNKLAKDNSEMVVDDIDEKLARDYMEKQ